MATATGRHPHRVRLTANRPARFAADGDGDERAQDAGLEFPEPPVRTDQASVAAWSAAAWLTAAWSAAAWSVAAW